MSESGSAIDMDEIGFSGFRVNKRNFALLLFSIYGRFDGSEESEIEA